MVDFVVLLYLFSLLQRQCVLGKWRGHVEHLSDTFNACGILTNFVCRQRDSYPASDYNPNLLPVQADDELFV
jgi:hypothetical protein